MRSRGRLATRWTPGRSHPGRGRKLFLPPSNPSVSTSENGIDYLAQPQETDSASMVKTLSVIAKMRRKYGR